MSAEENTEVKDPAAGAHKTPAAAFKTDNRKDFLDVSALFGKYAAAWIVAGIRNTRIRVLDVTGWALAAGLLGAGCIFFGTPFTFCLAAILIQVKNILDTVDGSLARARQTPSAIGRYADSVSDFLTSAAFFWAMAEFLARDWGREPAYALAGIAFLSQLLQCTYYVHYVVRFLAKPEPYGPFDARHPVWTQVFKGLYTVIYGWQDTGARRLDKFFLQKIQPSQNPNALHEKWYHDKRLLFLNSFIGLGTQLFFMSLFLWFARPGLYLWFMAVPANLYFAFLIFYRMRRYTSPSQAESSPNGGNSSDLSHTKSQL